MSEQRYPKKWWVYLSICALMLAAGTWLCWRRECQTCPPRPRYKTQFAVRNYHAATGRITFDATKDMATDTEEFGKLSYDLDGGYTLWVNRRYDFQEVLNYLNSWDKCYHGTDTYINSGLETKESKLTLTSTLEPGEIRITDGPALYGAIDGDRCYVDIPLCGDRVCPVEWGREVSCDDRETTILAATPTPLFIITDSTSILLECVLLSPAECVYYPTTSGDVLTIDWPHTIFVTNALSQTTVIQGPATIQFSDE